MADPVVTLVTAPGCHFCEDAQAVLTQLRERYPLRVQTVDVRSPRGEQLHRLHRPALNPLVVLDDAFFSVGRLPRRKLERLLSQRQTSMTEAG